VNSAPIFGIQTDSGGVAAAPEKDGIAQSFAHLLEEKQSLAIE
jgi:hypothetical protein